MSNKKNSYELELLKLKINSDIIYLPIGYFSLTKNIIVSDFGQTFSDPNY